MKIWDLISVCDVRGEEWKCCAVQHKACITTSLVPHSLPRRKVRLTHSSSSVCPVWKS